MNLIDNYFTELKTYFEEEDLQEYLEIKDVLTEHIEVSLEDGREIEEIIASMATPEEIAFDFFEDRRLATAINAKKDVVASEEVQAVFIQTLKKRMSVIAKSICHVIHAFFSLFLLCLLCYFVIYLVKELVSEKHLAIIPLSSILITASLLLLLLPRQVKIKYSYKFKSALYLLGTAGILIFAVGGLTNSLFYRGEDINQNLLIKDLKNVQLLIDSDADVEIAAIEVAENEPFRIMLDGRFSNSDRQKIQQATHKNKVNLKVDQATYWNAFTKTGNSDIIIFIPKGLVLDEINFNLINGKLRLIDVDTHHFNLNMTNGDFYGKNLSADSGTIENKYGDIVIEHSKSALDLTSFNGKTIIDYFSGSIQANTHDSLTIIKHSVAPNLSLNSTTGKVIVEDSLINKINAATDKGHAIIKYTVGDVDIQSNSGKVILQNNAGKLAIQNTSGPTISIQKEVQNSSIESYDGFIKWVQSNDELIDVDAKTKKGKLVNLMNQNSSTTKAHVKINSIYGDIRVVKSE